MKRVQLAFGVLALLTCAVGCHTMPWFVLFGPASWDPTGVCQLDGGADGGLLEWDCPDGGHGP